MYRMLQHCLIVLAGIILNLPTDVHATATSDLCALNKHSVAVVIGNKDYQGNIPSVPFAHNDSKAIKSFLINKLCYREANVIYRENATLGNFFNIFGRSTTPKGKLWNWVRKGRSNVFVYFSGHGAPDISTGDGFLVPVDGNPDIPALGFPLKTLLSNLKSLKANRVGKNRRIILMLDACFSGKEGTGKPLIKGSFSGWRPKRVDPGNAILQFNAASADQIARWDEQREHGLFTRAFLDAVSGEADKADYGDNNGRVSSVELVEYIQDEVSYLSRRWYSDDQTPEMPSPKKLAWRFSIDTTVRRDQNEAADNDNKPRVAEKKGSNVKVSGGEGNVTKKNANEPKSHEVDRSALKNGKDIQEIQARLYDLGFEPGRPDGIFGNKTRRAIRNFEKSLKQEISGVPSAYILSKLRVKKPPEIWGSIGFRPASKSIYSITGSTSRKSAEATIANECSGCQNIISFSNHECAAISLSDRGWGWAVRKSKSEANSAANTACQDFGGSCEIKKTICANDK